MRNIHVLHLWQLDLTILTAQISRSSVERTGVCGCQSAFTALIASNSNSKHTRKTLTDFGLTGTSLRHLDCHFKTLWDEEKSGTPLCGPGRSHEYEYEYEYEIFIALISQRNIRVQGSTSIKIYGYQHTTNKLNTKWKYKAMVQNHWIQCRTKMTMKWLVHIVAYTTGHSCNNPPGGHRTRRGRHCSETI